MKTLAELRLLSDEDLHKEILDLRKTQFQYRMHQAAGALEKNHVIRKVRRAIAQIKTIKTEKARNHGNK